MMKKELLLVLQVPVFFVMFRVVTGRFGPIPVRTPGRFGPIPFRSGRFGPGRFGPILEVGRFGPILVTMFYIVFR